METSDHPSSSSPSPSIFSVPEWDWDQPMTQQQLEELDAIESAFRSQTSSSTPTSQEADDRRKIRRRLPNSIGSNRCPSAFKGRDLNSFSLSPCPTNRFLNLFHSPCQENFKMRLPKMNFGGHIVYSRTVTEVEKATAELLKIVETKKKELGQAILGFDIEWRPTFRKEFLLPFRAVLHDDVIDFMGLCLSSGNLILCNKHGENLIKDNPKVDPFCKDDLPFMLFLGINQ
uniref:Werner Syndrome-like exonuclease n=1 Tax=Vitis vinifera TaxID=29760 RepID=A5BN69_VITVI|nr:hypothetical protein VITISV_041350 [Vitis vinifera]